MFVLDDSGIRYFFFCIIDNRISLQIAAIVNFFFKTDCTVFQFTELIVIIFINFASKDNFACDAFPILSVFKEISICSNLNSF